MVELVEHEPGERGMSPWKRKGRSIYWLSLPTRHGWKDKSTGTRDKPTARAMERMLDELGPRGKRAWDLLDRVAANTLSLGELYDAYRANDLNGLRDRLEDVDLNAYVTPWQEHLAGRLSQGERARYLAHLRTLIPEGKRFPRSELTVARLDTWLAQRKVGSSTQRKYYAAVHSFLGYCRRVHHLWDMDPLHGTAPPRANPSRVEYYDLDEVLRLLGAAQEPWQSLYALLYGTAMEVSVALGLTRRDVDLQEREVRARGTKTHARDRVASIAPWALPWVTKLVVDKLPDAPLFPKMDRWRANRKHREAAEAAKLKPLKLHAARNHWAVRMLKAGTPVELVARQLGHANAVMVLKAYGRFVPNRAERQQWEQKAEKR